MNKTTWLAALTLLSSPTFAETVSVEMIDLGSGQSTGTVMISDSDYGTVFTPKLQGLPAGTHGFHLHANGSCDSITKEGKTILGGAAGGHYDPEKTGKHGLPLDGRQSSWRFTGALRECSWNGGSASIGTTSET